MEEENKKTEETTTEPVTTPEPAESLAPEGEAAKPEEPKKKGSNGFIIVLLVIFLAVFAVWFFALGGNETLGFKKPEEAPNKEEKKEDEKEESIKEVQLEAEETDKLISYVPEATPYNKDRDYSAYDSKKVSINEMDANWLVYRAMQDVSNKGECTTEQFNLNGICDFTLQLEDVKTAVKNLYGSVNINYPNVVENNFLWKCTLDNDVYACSNTGGGYAANEVSQYFRLAGTTRTFTKHIKAEKDSENLYLYVKYAKMEMVFDEQNVDAISASDVTFRIRKYGTGNEVIDDNILSGSDYYEENASVTFYDKIYEQFKDKLTNYKITYKITGDNSYNLVSVEPVK